ncbi:TetR/AcrR family transcriptional regulator [Desulfospira joergensenii]|uniref:TetR/AcrR family transcriptional regulator n=1 Tax=Desulfospira joergensenii TaxID=53329 RepID=UPI0003B38ACD|nr:TetR/AcrR family transcriptional regulator [Desulfospira joergensenii]
MPPKFKFSKKEIVDSAFKLVRFKGWDMLSARSLANELGSSSKPIYSYFKSMEELEETIAKKGVDLLYEYMIRERTDDPWHNHGIGYVMFAQKEKRLFRALNDEKHIKYYGKYGEIIWETLTASLPDYPPFQGLSGEQVYQIQLQRWLLCHGLAFKVSNPLPDGVWDDEMVSTVIQQGSTAILKGLKIEFFSNRL